MAIEIVMPALEMAQDVGVLISWLKSDGESVSKGDLLFEVETDKAVIEIESPGSGILSNVSASAGNKVPIGQVIAYLLEEGEDIPKDAILSITDVSKAQGESKLRVLGSEKAHSALKKKSKLVAASPKARRLATELDIDLSALSASLADRAIQAKDVLDVGSIKIDDLIKKNAYDVIEMNGMRRAIAQRVIQSHQNAPPISLTLSIDMSEAISRIDDWNKKQAKIESKIKLSSLLCLGVAKTLTQHRELNGHIIYDEIHRYNAVHLGVAVALEDGLMIPVIRNAQSLTMEKIHLKLNELADRARKQRLKKEEMSGSTFTLSNLGMYGVEQFISILNPPEVGILSVGTVKDTPVGVEGKIELRSIMQVTINADHRAVDGVAAAQFLKTLKNTFESPASLFE